MHVAGLALFVSGCLLNPQPDDPGSEDDKKTATNGEAPGTKPGADYGSRGGAGADAAGTPMSGGASGMTVADVAVAGASMGAVGGCAFTGLAGSGGGFSVDGGGVTCGVAGTSVSVLP